MTASLSDLFSRSVSRLGRLVVMTLGVTLLAGCGYNAMQAGDEQVKAAWSEVLNQYQRRADLIPALVKSVDAYMTNERAVLKEVTEARARVGSVQMSTDNLEDPQAMERFQQAQGSLSSALSRLLVVTENYPTLKADALFRDLQAELAGTENRIAVARGRYVQQVQAYNTLIRQFPGVITAKIMGYAPKANFSVENEAAISRAPAIEFSNTRGATPPAAPAPVPAAR